MYPKSISSFVATLDQKLGNRFDVEEMKVHMSSFDPVLWENVYITEEVEKDGSSTYRVQETFFTPTLLIFAVTKKGMLRKIFY